MRPKIILKCNYFSKKAIKKLTNFVEKNENKLKKFNFFSQIIDYFYYSYTNKRLANRVKLKNDLFAIDEP